MTERWLPVLGHGGYYEVSDMGQVRSLDRTCIAKDGTWCRYAGRTLIANPRNTKGGRRVQLYCDGCLTVRYVAHLVLDTFVGPRPPGTEAYHKNDLDDDSLVNLEWRVPVGQRGGSRVGRRGRRSPLHLTLAGWWAAERANHQTTATQFRDPDPRWHLTEAGLAVLNTPHPTQHNPPKETSCPTEVHAFLPPRSRWGFSP